MGEGVRLIEICNEINADPPTILIQDPFSDEDVQVSVMDAAEAINDRLERYRGQISNSALESLGVMLRDKFRKSILAQVQEIRGIKP